MIETIIRFRVLRFTPLLLLGVFFFFSGKSPTVSHAQDNLQSVCEALITRAIQQIGSACQELGRNEACYGNTHVSAVLTDEQLEFDAEGDIVPVEALSAIITRPANPETDEWGIATMNLQADLPEAENNSVRLVMFGGVEINPTPVETGQPLDACQFSNISASNLNLRSGPGRHYRVMDILDQGAQIPVYGQSKDGEWLRSSRGWLYAELGQLACNGKTLATFEDVNDAYTAPMQSFTFQVNDQGTCQTAPAGLLVQVPHGQTANILVNSVEIRLGSTAFITLDSNGELVVANLEGNVGVTAGEVTMILPVGAQASVPLTEAMAPVDTPHDLEPIQGTTTQISSLLLEELPEAVALPLPFNTNINVSTSGITVGQGSNNVAGVTVTEDGVVIAIGDDDCLLSGLCGGGGSGGGGSTIPGVPDLPLPPLPTATLSVSSPVFNCFLLPILVPVTYNSPQGDTISSFSANSSNTLVGTILNILLGAPNQVHVLVNCLGFGSTTITANVTDSAGTNLSISFVVNH